MLCQKLTDISGSKNYKEKEIAKKPLVEDFFNLRSILHKTPFLSRELGCGSILLFVWPHPA